MTKLACTSFSLVVLLVSATTLAEVVARQGVPDVTQFHSPMILALPLPDFTHLPVGAAVALGADLRKYTCDDVSLSKLTLQVKEHANSKRSTLALELSGAVHVPSSQDRLVDIVFEVKKGNLGLGITSIRQIEAEEDRSTKFHTVLYLDESRLKDAFASSPTPSLELTLKVSGNT